MENYRNLLNLLQSHQRIFRTLRNIKDGEFCKKVNSFQLLTILVERSILYVSQISEYATAYPILIYFVPYPNSLCTFRG